MGKFKEYMISQFNVLRNDWETNLSLLVIAVIIHCQIIVVFNIHLVLVTDEAVQKGQKKKRDAGIKWMFGLISDEYLSNTDEKEMGINLS